MNLAISVCNEDNGIECEDVTAYKNQQLFQEIHISTVALGAVVVYIEVLDTRKFYKNV